MMRKYNRVREALRTQRPVCGFICRTLSPAAVELIGLCGLDFVWIDMEHSTADFSTVEHLCRAADAVDLEALVRVPDQSPSNILRALEAGAGIVNAPQVDDRSQAESVVRAAKYGPAGERGYSSASRGTRYGVDGAVQEVFAIANERVMTMVQIESVLGAQNAEEICSVPNLDIVFIGLGDLSQSMGLTGQLGHPRLVESARRILESIVRNGKIPAMHLEKPEAAQEWIDLGVRIVCCGVDLTSLKTALLGVHKAFGVVRDRQTGTHSGS
jgi:2-keto-3-deoxy-L-rhamnonate aldolase RhmA